MMTKAKKLSQPQNQYKEFKWKKIHLCIGSLTLTGNIVTMLPYVKYFPCKRKGSQGVKDIIYINSSSWSDMHSSEYISHTPGEFFQTHKYLLTIHMDFIQLSDLF